MNRETFGAIDIGSNAIRLLIDYVEQYEDQRTEYKKAAFVRVPVRLGDDVFLRGHIGNDRAEALCDAMQGFAALLRAYGVRDYRACATSAMREAANSRDILERVRLRSGITVETISGEEEAETIFAAGGLKERLDPTKSYLLCRRGRRQHDRDRRLRPGAETGGRIVPPRDGPHSERGDRPGRMKRFEEWLVRMAEAYRPTVIIGSGGNINKVHKLLEKRSRETRYLRVL